MLVSWVDLAWTVCWICFLCAVSFWMMYVKPVLQPLTFARIIPYSVVLRNNVQRHLWWVDVRCQWIRAHQNLELGLKCWKLKYVFTYWFFLNFNIWNCGAEMEKPKMRRSLGLFHTLNLFFIFPLTESVFRLPISMWRTAAHPVWSPMKVFPLYLFQVRRALSPVFVLFGVWFNYVKRTFY